MERMYTISVFTENSPGVLHRLTSCLTRRKVNIESLTVSETETKGVSRFTIVVNTDPELVMKIVKQIDRIIEVVEAFVSENQQLIYREIAFIKVDIVDAEKRLQVEELAHRYGAHVTYATEGAIVVEKTGTEDEIDSLYRLLEPFRISEFVRSGRIAIRKTPRSEEDLLEG